MKHLEPLMTHLSPLRVAVVFIPDTSEPALGSVRQKDANRGASVRRPRYSRLSSSDAARMTGAVARPLQVSDVAIPEQPQDSSSSMIAPSRKPRPGPPYSEGRWLFINPSSHAFSRISPGQVPSLSYSQATGRISFSAKSCAISRMLFCSSVRVKSTTVFSFDSFRLTSQSMCSCGKDTPNRCPRNTTLVHFAGGRDPAALRHLKGAERVRHGRPRRLRRRARRRARGADRGTPDLGGLRSRPPADGARHAPLHRRLGLRPGRARRGDPPDARGPQRPPAPARRARA